MGGWNSGRSGGRPTADMSQRIDIAWMIRTGKAIPGNWAWGSLSWDCGGTPAGSIGYEVDMRDPYASELRLSYSRGTEPDREHVKQTVRLEFTTPHYGGRRWWMICPYRHIRVGKLYLPNGGDRFASRQAWRLGYESQRVAHLYRPFEKLFRLQRKLGCAKGWGQPIYRPKGMWRRTFERHDERYEELNARCNAGALAFYNRIDDDLEI